MFSKNQQSAGANGGRLAAPQYIIFLKRILYFILLSYSSPDAFTL